MKKILLVILTVILTLSSTVFAKGHGGNRPPPNHHHKPHGHGSNNSSGGEAAAIVLVATSVTATSYALYQLLAAEQELNKLVYIKAKDDAALFIATEGEQTGVYLESALQQLRTKTVLSNISDRELAEAILAI